jgi:hypothetical protein
MIEWCLIYALEVQKLLVEQHHQVLLGVFDHLEIIQQLVRVSLFVILL